jgi:peptidylprolyl isomerase
MRSLTSIAFALAVSSAGCVLRRQAELPAPIPRVSGDEHVAFALRDIDIAPGSGALADARKCFYVHYTGWLTNGMKFDSSRDTMPNGRQRQPISFPQGFRRVIAGWDLGFERMRVGGRRRLFIPYQLGYGEAGRSPIPPKAELIFDVELMAVADTVAEARPEGAASPRCPPWTQVSS